MKIIGVFKFGTERYKNGVDVNSGEYERQLIMEKVGLESIVVDLNVEDDFIFNLFNASHRFDAIVIIGGAMSANDSGRWNAIRDYRKFINKRCKCVFVATDIDSITKLEDVINQCDYCLTQTDYMFPNILVPQMYGYTAELFYKPSGIRAIRKLEKGRPELLSRVFFAGSSDGREDKMLEYLFEDKKLTKSKPLTTSITKTKKFDNRVTYQNQMELLEAYEFTLMIVTKECRDIGWITSRLFEALSVGTVPLVDFEYDVYEKYISADSILRVHDHETMVLKIKDFIHRNNRLELLEEVNTIRTQARINNRKFIELLFTLLD